MCHVASTYVTRCENRENICGRLCFQRQYKFDIFLSPPPLPLIWIFIVNYIVPFRLWILSPQLSTPPQNISVTPPPPPFFARLPLPNLIFLTLIGDINLRFHFNNATFLDFFSPLTPAPIFLSPPPSIWIAIVN